MKAVSGALVAILLLAVAGCGQGDQSADSAGAQPGPPVDHLSDAQLAAAYNVIRVKSAAGGKVMNDCGEAVAPGIHHADLGGAVGRAWLVMVGGGPTTAGCYGNAGDAFWLLQSKGDSFRVILEGSGSISVLTTEHNGVKDVAIGGPGFQFPVFVWNGNGYKHQGSISDSKMPPAVN
jgi:hypothetical protein